MAVINYADNFQPDFGLPWAPLLPAKRLPGMPPEQRVLEELSIEELQQYVEGRELAEKLAIDNPVGNGWTLPAWRQVKANWSKYNVHVVLGGNQCLRGDTEIYDPVLGISRRIDSICGLHHVSAWDGEKTVIAEAEQPFPKTAGPMVTVTLSTGDVFCGALEHRVLCADGKWLSLSQLRPGCVLFRPPSISEPSLCALPAGERHSMEMASVAGGDYHLSPPDGAPLRPSVAAGPSFFLQPANAPTRISLLRSICRWPWLPAERSSRCTSGARDNISSRSRFWLRCVRPSSRGVLSQIAVRFVGILSRACDILCKSASRLCVNPGFGPARRQSVVGCGRQPLSSDGLFRPGKQSHCASTYVISVASGGTGVKWDMTVPPHGNYIAAGVVHHNSGKTVLGSRMAVWAAATIPEAETYCWHVSEKRSIDDQQRFIYEALPSGIKALPTKKGVHHSTQYSQKNGFTDSICILPPQQGYRRGGSINFFNYAQYQQNDQIIEGVKAHFVWADEKIPLALMETLRARFFTYHGRLLLTYTVIDGWNDTIEKILAKTKTIERRYCDHPRIKGYLPVMQESLSMDSCCIYYAWTQDNPFTDWVEFNKLYATADKTTILARAYGIPTKSIAGAFPSFSREVNVIPHDDLPWIKAEREAAKTGKPAVKYPVTRYMAIDPAGSKNWFMAWVAIDPAGTWWVYREWPDYDDWALPGSTVEGKPGPAQKGTGKGIKDYVELIRAAEGDEEIYERVIDPRMGAAERQSQDGATTIISDLDEADMVVIPAPGVDITNGLQRITNLLAWDENKPRDSVNSPHLFVSDRCQNIIFALAEYTGKGGTNEATKDAIDPLRYLVVSGAEYFEASPQDDRATGVY